MYGSALARTYYGAGDYNRAAASAHMVGGYYTAGGFFSKLGGALKKVAAPVAKVVSNPIVGGALSFVPGGGLISKGIGLASKVLSSPVAKVASGALAVSGGVSAARSVMQKMTPAAGALARVAVPAGVAGGAAGIGQGLTRRRRKRKGKGRGKTVTVRVTGATRVKKRRSRKSQSGKRVSFRTKDGRTVTFTRK